jgi:hypothetical protein
LDAGRTSHLAGRPTAGHRYVVDEPLIERAEVVALLFNVSDIHMTLLRVEALLQEDDDEAEEDE